VSARRINLILRTLAVAMTAGAIGALAWAFLSPVKVDTDSAGLRRMAPAASAPAADSLPPLASFEPIWKLDLRKPLDGAPAAAPLARQAAATAPANNGIPITLVGTIGDSLALVRTADGAVEVKAVGESAAGAKIVSVRPSQIDVEFAGQVVTLRKPKVPDGG
jgi:hypothetical protein